MFVSYTEIKMTEGCSCTESYKTFHFWYAFGKDFSHDGNAETVGSYALSENPDPERILSWSFYSDPVVLEALGWVEVEDEEHIGPVKYNDFVLLMLGADKSLEDKRRKESSYISS